MKRMFVAIAIVLSILIMGFSRPSNRETLHILSQKDSTVLILWEANLKLDWDDFRALPNSKSQYKALTYVNIKMIPLSYGVDSIVYNIPCYFNADESWSKNKSSTSLLKHEQLHFDIAELITRRIRKRFNEYKLTNLKTAYSDLDKIFDKVGRSERDSINARYDKETNHGIIEAKQKEWDKKIASELKSLDKYSSVRVVVDKK